MLPIVAPKHWGLEPSFFLVLLVCCVSRELRSEHFEGFESKTATWRLLGADNRSTLKVRKRVTDEKHGGFSCEYLRIATGEGSYAHVGHEIPPAAVIAELAPSIWIKANKPGYQFMARATLPRTISSKTGKPVTTLLYGPLYTDAGYWQKLSFSNIYTAFERQIRIMRSQTTESIDPREAVIDMVVINAYGGAGETEMWVDDLEIKGHIAPRRIAEPFPASSQPGDANRVEPKAEAFEFRGGKTLVNGRPIFIRAIEHNGESLAHLSELGFNAVVLSRPSDAKMRDAAARNNVWLISPPPVDVAGATLDSRYDRVIGWYLGDHFTARDLALCRLRAEELKRFDLKRRMILCGVGSSLWNFSRLVDVPIVSRGGSFSAYDKKTQIDWLRNKHQLVRPGGVLWQSIATQAPDSMTQQLLTIFPRETTHPLPEMSQLRSFALRAIAGGARGLFFTSRESLQSPTSSARLRSNMLRRLNIELAHIEPWAASGELMPDLQTASTDFRITSLRLENSRLISVFHNSPDQQFTTSPSEEKPISFADETASTSARAWLLQPANLEPVRTRRRPGGLEISLSVTQNTTLAIITENAATLREITNRLATHARESSQLDYNITQTELTRAAGVIGKLEGFGQTLPQAAEQLGQIRANLQQAERLMLGGDYRASGFYSAKAMRVLQNVRRMHWERAALAFPSAVASPLCCSFQTLPRHYELGDLLKTGKWGVNHLAGGTLENLNHLTQTNWKNQRNSDSQLNTVVQIDPAAARSGGGGLRLKAWPKQNQQSLSTVETAPVWITSSPTPVKAGTLVRINGWAKLTKPVQGSSDGLVIFDSIGQSALAHRVVESGEWKEFTLYRAVAKDTDVVVTFALTGIGEAWLDDISITPISLPTLFPKPLTVGSNSTETLPRPDLSKTIRN